MVLNINLGAIMHPPPAHESASPGHLFQFQKVIGRGGEGVVYAAVRNDTAGTGAASSAGNTSQDDKESVAVKVIEGRSFDRCRAMSHIWPALAHPNVVFPRSVYFDDANSRCYVEMELLSTDLLDHVLREGNLLESKASEIAGHLAAALDHLHQRGVAHRDIKPENVFLRDGVAKLGDLGSIVFIQRPNGSIDAPSRSFNNLANGSTTLTVSAAEAAAAAAAETMGFKLTTTYAPPEYLDSDYLKGSRGATAQGHDPFAGDMWSLGITLYGAVAGFNPWAEASERCSDFKRFQAEGIEATLPDSFSPGFKSLLERLLQLDPSERPTAADVLADPWVTAPPVSSPSSFSPPHGVVPVAVGPALITTTTPKSSTTPEDAGPGTNTATGEMAEAATVAIAPVEKRGNCRSIAAVSHPATVAVADEEVALPGSRKRKRPLALVKTSASPAIKRRECRSKRKEPAGSVSRRPLTEAEVCAVSGLMALRQRFGG